MHVTDLPVARLRWFLRPMFWLQRWRFGQHLAPAKVWAVDHWRESDAFDPRERLALEYAEAITRTEGQVTDALVAALRQHFDEAALIELTALVAFQNLSSKFNAALDIPAQGFCRIAPR